MFDEGYASGFGQRGSVMPDDVYQVVNGRDKADGNIVHARTGCRHSDAWREEGFFLGFQFLFSFFLFKRIAAILMVRVQTKAN